MSNIIITGGQGFVGKHLTHLLQDGTDNNIVDFSYSNGCDLLDYEQIRRRLDGFRPDYIYHLAAQAYVAESFTSPRRTFEVNTIGSLNLLEAVRQLGLKTKILLAGTSEEYGDAEPLEDGYMNPKSPYAISKLAMDKLGLLYAKSYNMHVVVTRAFNHTGAGRGEQYAESSFAKQIVAIEKGQQRILTHGNLESIRNYTDVQDIVKAYTLAIDLEPDVYNICSEQNVSMRDVLDTLIDLSETAIPHQANAALFRPIDFSFKEPNCKKFQELTNWKPEIKLKQTLADLLDYWRTQ